MALNITAEQYAIAQSYAQAGDYVGGWEYLASIGDNYADNAHVVVSGNASSIIDRGFQILVEKHWANTVGPNAYAERFEQVALQHFQQYVDTIGENDGYTLPSSRQIEQSYRDAVTDAGLPPETAFDGVYTRSWGDLADALYPGPKSSGWDWTDWLGMEDARQVESNVFNDIDRSAAWEIVLKDMWHTVEELVQQGFNDAAEVWNQMFDDAARSFLDFALDLSNSLNGLIDSLRNRFTSAEAQSSPIILDLDGNGIDTVGFSEGVHFDHDGNGFAQLTGWVGANDGLLVWDRNGNGVIDNGSELFGDNTVLTNGLTAVNGFAALAEHDSNGDGAIDANDAIWSELRVWRDTLRDGVTQEGELAALDELGISSINLSYSNSSYVDVHGNAHKQVGSFTWADGTVGTATDVWFSADYARTRAIDLVEIPEDIAALPDLQGFGNVHSLHQAANDVTWSDAA